MTQDLKSRLKSLPADPTGAFGALMTRAVGPVAAKRLEKPLRSLILTLPELLSGYQELISRPPASSGLRRVHSFLLTYLYHDRDLIPDEGNGLYGYIDDAYLAGSAYMKARRELGQEAAGTRRRALETKLPGWLAAVRKVLPNEARRMDEMLEDLVDGRYGSFERAIGGARA